MAEKPGLLVGADGAWSRTRLLLSDAARGYTGVSFVESDLLDADARHPASAAGAAAGCSSRLATARASSPTV